MTVTTPHASSPPDPLPTPGCDPGEAHPGPSRVVADLRWLRAILLIVVAPSVVWATIPEPFWAAVMFGVTALYAAKLEHGFIQDDRATDAARAVTS